VRGLDSFRLALSFLTVVPAGSAEGWPTAARARAVTWFPLIGLLIGIAVYAVLRLPLPPLPRAALALIIWVAITGGLHDDGWMDSLDAAFAPVPRERRLAILRDPHVGAHAVTGGVLLQIARFAALAVVPAAAILVATVLGRTAMSLSVALASPARPDGLGASLATGARPLPPAALGLAILTGIAALSTPVQVALAVLAGGAAANCWGIFLTRRLGGLSGDGHGSLGVVAELVSLWAFVPIVLRPS